MMAGYATQRGPDMGCADSFLYGASTVFLAASADRGVGELVIDQHTEYEDL